ncbi:poly(R)-hydroxyalkanoic acid synthase subunit PhaE [Natroniella sp. ANB-PHB2]|uniref:poly(R)-hydroxyalkanoic acid synthase subunit PhaE n=1 Tax=Natroniella sp. ANB-PHB2 TaxID=3384444 RepID=UPI0038D3DCF9
MLSNKEENNLMEEWLETQKEMFDMWQNNFMTEKENGFKKTMDFVDNIGESTKFLKEWTQMNTDLFEKNINLLKEGSTQETFKKIINGANIYSDLSRFWQDLEGGINIDSNIEEIREFCNKWNKEYKDIFSERILSSLPEGMQSFFTEPIEIINIFKENIETSFSPLLDNPEEFQELLTKNPLVDKETFLDYAKYWKKKYDKTFGQLSNIPIMGINRNYSTRAVDSIDSFMNYINNLNEFYGMIYKAGADALEDIVIDYQNMLEDDSQPKTLKEFYHYWWRKNEKAFKDLFNTEEFSKLLNQVAESAASFKQNYDKLLEKQLEGLPLPTMTDMDSLYKTVYNLKNNVKNLNKKANMFNEMKDDFKNISELEKEIKSLKKESKKSKEQVKDLEKKLKEDDSDVVKELEKEIKSLKKESKKSKKQVKDLEKKLKEDDSDVVKELEKEIKSLKKESKKSKKQVEDLEEKLKEDASDVIKEFEKEIESLKKESKKSKKQVKDLEEKLKEDASDVVKELEKEIKSLKKESKKSKKQVKDLEEKLKEDASDVVNELEKEIKSLEKESKKSKKQIKNLEKKLEGNDK